MPRMPKTMLCLASEQTLPNAIAARQLAVTDLLVLRTTDEVLSKAPAERLERWWRAAGGTVVAAGPPLSSSVKPDRLRDEIARQLAGHGSRQWIVNLTGGNKPMSIVAHELALQHNLEAVYVDPDPRAGRQLVWFNRPPATGDTQPWSARFKVREVMSLNGAEVRSSQPWSAALDRAARTLAADRSLLAVLNRARRGAAKLAVADGQQEALTAAGLAVCTPAEGSPRVALTALGHQASAKSGSWLEWVAGAALARAGADDILLNVTPAGVEYEADAIGAFGPDLVILSCKTGGSVPNADFTALGDQRTRFGGRSAIGALVWSGPDPARQLDDRQRQSLASKRVDYAARARTQRLRFAHSDDPDALAEQIRTWLAAG